MKSNRRSVLIGLGALTVGGGAVFGTGAFSTVEAERTVSVETAADSDAFLSLTPASGAEDYVDDAGDTIEIDIGGGGDGVNQDALTTFDELVEIASNGTNDVDDITISIEGENGEDEILSIIENFDDLPLENDTESVTFGLEVELRADEVGDTSVAAYDGGDIDDNFDPTITIEATTSD